MNDCMNTCRDVLPASGEAASTDPHPEWLQQWKQCRAAINAMKEDTRAQEIEIGKLLDEIMQHL